MKETLIIAGFGGQGVLSMGKILAYSGVMQDFEVLIRVVPIIIESIRRSHVGTHDNLESFKRAKRSHSGICNAIATGNVMEAKFLAERHLWETLDDLKIRKMEEKT